MLGLKFFCRLVGRRRFVHPIIACHLMMSSRRIESQNFKNIVTPELLRLEELFKSKGYDIRLVGGVVRDLLLDKLPNDVDIGTDCVPKEMIKIFEDESIRYIPTGLQHGTVTVVMKGTSYEITTLRSDVATDGRWASVEFVKDWKVDAMRRDLTINAMSLSLDGQLYDYFSGENHLAKRKILFVGNPRARIEEDYLRILRYFRFYGRFVPASDQHDSDTLEAIRDLGEGLRRISAERIWMEMHKIVVGNHAPSLLALMKDLSVTSHIGLPSALNIDELERVWRCTRGQSFHNGELAPPLQPVSLLASLVNSVDFLALADTWKLSNKEKMLGAFLGQNREEAMKDTSTLKYYQDFLVSSIERGLVLELARYCNHMDHFLSLKDWTIPVMPVNGKDLLAAGIPKGRKCGMMLAELKKRWMDSGFEMGKEELLEIVARDDKEDTEHPQSEQNSKKQKE